MNFKILFNTFLNLLIVFILSKYYLFIIDYQISNYQSIFNILIIQLLFGLNLIYIDIRLNL